MIKNPELNIKIKNLHTKGFTDREIASELNISLTSVQKRRRLTLNLKANKPIKPVIITDDQKSIIIGSLLGDMSCYKRNNSSKRNPIISLKHSEKQCEYFYWKYHKLLNIIDSKPYMYTDKDEINTICFSSRSRKELNFFYDLFYNNGKKLISVNLLEHITPLSIAVWYMDDGSCAVRNNRSDIFKFVTYSFSYKENQALADFLTKKYNIEFYVAKHNSGGKIYSCLKIRTKDNYKFIKLISPYIHSSMIYKLGTGLDKGGELLENQETDNQQPSLSGNTFEGSETSRRYVTSHVDVSNSTTSAVHV